MFWYYVYGFDWILTEHCTNTLQSIYAYNKKVMKECGLSRIPSRRTFDRRLTTLSGDIKNRITTMGKLFVHEKIIDPSILSTDSTLIKAKGHVWHKSSMKKRKLHLKDQMESIWRRTPAPKRLRRWPGTDGRLLTNFCRASGRPRRCWPFLFQPTAA